MHICMIVGEFPPKCAGIGIYAYNLSKKLIERGHQVTVFTRGSWKNNYKYENFHGINVFRVFFVPIYPFHVKLHGFILMKKFKEIKTKFDIIHFHSPLIQSFKTEKPTIATMHASASGTINSKDSLDFHSKITKKFYKLFLSSELEVLNNSDMITTVSESCTHELMSKYSFNKDMWTVNNGVDTEYFTFNNFKKAPNINILYTGRLDSGKGLIDLITAADIVCKEYNHVNFYIVGNGPLENYLKKMVKKLNLAKNFNFVGFVSNFEIIKYYHQATIYVFPSYHEGFPTTLLEAMSCGLPVVATKVEGNMDLIINNKNGLLVPPKCPKKLAEAIIKLINDRSLQNKLGLNARKYIESNYDWDVITDKFLKIYNLIRDQNNNV